MPELIDKTGLRTDVEKSFRELNLPVVRYSGGLFVTTYHLSYGVGPEERRPRWPELAWTGVGSNEFDTNEFMK